MSSMNRNRQRNRLNNPNNTGNTPVKDSIQGDQNNINNSDQIKFETNIRRKPTIDTNTVAAHRTGNDEISFKKSEWNKLKSVGKLFKSTSPRK